MTTHIVEFYPATCLVSISISNIFASLWQLTYILKTVTVLLKFQFNKLNVSEKVRGSVSENGSSIMSEKKRLLFDINSLVNRKNHLSSDILALKILLGTVVFNIIYVIM